MSHSRNKLPTEILLRIFELVYHTYDFSFSRVRTLRQGRLVCKDWNKAAQKYYYKDITMDKSADKLLDTLRNNISVRSHVRKVSFDESFLTVENLYGKLEQLFGYCPGIRELYTEDGRVNEMLLPYLLQEGTQLKNLEMFCMEGALGYDYITHLIAPFVALKFCKTLKDLDLRMDTFVDNVAQHRQKLLIDQLSSFVSLTHLSILNLKSLAANQIEKILNDCSSTLSSLVIHSFEISPWDKSLDEIKPMKHLKNLRIVETDNFALPTLEYFAHKFTGLEKLIIQSFKYPNENEEDWWNCFIPVCQRLKIFNIETRFSRTAVQQQIEKCAHLAVKSAEGIVNKKLSFSFKSSSERIYSNIVMTKNSSTLAVKLEFYHVKDLIYWMKEYAPNTVEFTGIELMNKHYEKFVVSETDAHMTELMPICLRIYFEIFCKARSLSTFMKSLKTFGRRQQSTSFAFDKIILCGKWNELDEGLVENYNIARLSFKHSVLFEDVLPIISSKMIKLDKLTIDTCSILTNEPYNLKIFLPATRLGSLALIFAPFINATDDRTFLTSNGAPDLDNFLENEALVSAVSPTGCYTLKIETERRSCVIQRQGNKSVAYKRNVRVHGTKNNFLIWIKCLELTEFMVAGDKSRFRSPHKFESFE